MQTCKVPTSIVSTVVCLYAAAALIGAPSQAADFPSRSVRIVVPVPPGGSADLVARLLGGKLQESLGQPVVIENRAGAGALLATELVARSAPDGHTMLLAFAGMMLMPSMSRNLGFDVRTDLTPVIKAVNLPFVLVANANLPVSSAKELISYARANPGKLNIGITPGTGGMSHLAGEYLRSQTGIDVVFVPYKGSTPGLVAVLAGEIQLFIDVVASSAPHLSSGKLRALAVLDDKRTAFMPSIPTAEESGLPAYDGSSWMGFFTRGGTPGNVVSRLHSDMAKALLLAEVRDKLTPLGMDPAGDTPEEFARSFNAGVNKWGALIRANGIKIE